MTGRRNQDCLAILGAIRTAVPVITKERAGPAVQGAARGGKRPALRVAEGMCAIKKEVAMEYDDKGALAAAIPGCAAPRAGAGRRRWNGCGRRASG